MAHEDAVGTADALDPFGGDVVHLRLAPNVDERGVLREVDFEALPFPVRRMFWVTDVPAGTQRGGHRHRVGQQVFFCVTGAVEVELRRGDVRAVVVLTPGSGALCIAAGVWASQRYLTEGSALLVLASEPFDPANYETSY
jgi:dTDP-4-dehydrorhamnose 3,5-epimerase-like enzyme